MKRSLFVTVMMTILLGLLWILSIAATQPVVQRDPVVVAASGTPPIPAKQRVK